MTYSVTVNGQNIPYNANQKVQITDNIVTITEKNDIENGTSNKSFPTTTSNAQPGAQGDLINQFLNSDLGKKLVAMFPFLGPLLTGLTSGGGGGGGGGGAGTGGTTTANTGKDNASNSSGAGKDGAANANTGKDNASNTSGAGKDGAANANTGKDNPPSTSGAGKDGAAKTNKDDPNKTGAPTEENKVVKVEEGSIEQKLNLGDSYHYNSSYKQGDGYTVSRNSKGDYVVKHDSSASTPVTYPANLFPDGTTGRQIADHQKSVDEGGGKTKLVVTLVGPPGAGRNLVTNVSDKANPTHKLYALGEDVKPLERVHHMPPTGKEVHVMADGTERRTREGGIDEFTYKGKKLDNDFTDPKRNRMLDPQAAHDHVIALANDGGKTKSYSNPGDAPGKGHTETYVTTGGTRYVVTNTSGGTLADDKGRMYLITRKGKDGQPDVTMSFSCANWENLEKMFKRFNEDNPN